MKEETRDLIADAKVDGINLSDGDKLFTTPPATLPSGNRSECDCEELVEALTRLSHAVTMQRVVTEQESIALRMANKRAQEALANHAKRMKLTKATLGEE